jgi:hypothetical protein
MGDGRGRHPISICVRLAELVPLGRLRIRHEAAADLVGSLQGAGGHGDRLVGKIAAVFVEHLHRREHGIGGPQLPQSTMLDRLGNAGLQEAAVVRLHVELAEVDVGEILFCQGTLLGRRRGRLNRVRRGLFGSVRRIRLLPLGLLPRLGLAAGPAFQERLFAIRHRDRAWLRPAARIGACARAERKAAPGRTCAPGSDDAFAADA